MEAKDLLEVVKATYTLTSKIKRQKELELNNGVVEACDVMLQLLECVVEQLLAIVE